MLVLAGLNSPVSTARVFNEIQDVGPNPGFEEKIQRVRKQMETFRRYREMPVERGWSGRKAHGRPSGQPDDYNETSYDDFDSTVLMLRRISRMTGLFGDVRYMQALVVTGNGKGLAGFATAKGKDGRATVRHARNLALQNQIFIKRWEDHTVMHDFHSKYYETAVFVERKPRGYGLRCHRVLEAICKAFGIEDMYAKVDGVPDNTINLTKAFFLGLLNQKDYQDMADEKRLHLVDMREETFNYPRVLASPSDSVVLTDDQIKGHEDQLDFTYYINEGRIRMIKPKFKQPWIDGPTWGIHLDRVDMNKNRESVKLQLAAKYGNKEVLDVFPYFRTTAKAFNKGSEGE